MRDKNHIPKLLTALEKVWKKHPDFRLGQLITVLTRPTAPHPATFYIEDDKMLEALETFEYRHAIPSKKFAYWERYPRLAKVDEITADIVLKMIHTVKAEDENIIISARKLMELTGAPITDYQWMEKQQPILEKLNTILIQLENEGILQIVELGYRLT